MRLKPEDMQELRRLLVPVIDRMPVPEYRRLHPDFSDKRVRWDYFHATGREGLAFLCQTIYSYANDAHLDTALKSILGGEK